MTRLEYLHHIKVLSLKTTEKNKYVCMTIRAVYSILIMLFLLGIVNFNILRKKYALSEDYLYVIAIHIDVDVDDAVFQYQYFGKIYKNSHSYDGRSFEIGSRFYAKISKKKPEISKILYKKPVPDTITTQPSNGWSSLPPIDKKKIPSGDLSQFFEDDEGYTTSNGYIFYVCFILLVSVLIFYRNIKTSYLLQKESVYVVAILIEATSEDANDEQYDKTIFKFTYQHKEYTKKEVETLKTFKLGHKCYARIYPKDPTFCRILYKEIVKEETEQPENGWITIPDA